MTKITAQFYEADEGSDDPSAIQGGGGASERLVRTVHVSPYLITKYLIAHCNRYGDMPIARFPKVSA